MSETADDVLRDFSVKSGDLEQFYMAQLHELPDFTLPMVFLIAWTQFERALHSALRRFDPRGESWDPLRPLRVNWEAFLAASGEEAIEFRQRTFARAESARASLNAGWVTDLTPDQWRELIAGWQHLIAVARHYAAKLEGL